MTLLKFFVPGKPVPGGSKKAFALRRKDGSLVMRKGTNYPVINVTDAAGKENKIWRERVTLVAKGQMRSRAPHKGGCVVTMTFFMPRPQDHYGTGRNEATLKHSAPPRHLQAPDALKLARSTEDALTGVVWHDDCQTIDLHLFKRWAEPGKDGCLIEVELLDDAQIELPIPASVREVEAKAAMFWPPKEEIGLPGL